MNYTDEQIAIINAKEPVVKVEALAGSGKTTVLVEFCKKRVKKKILYLVFNSSMKKEGQAVYKENNVFNTTIKTTHGLAWFPYGKKYNDAKKLSMNYKPYDINRDLNLNDTEFAGSLLNIWNKYITSDSLSVDEFCDDYFDKNSEYKNRVSYNIKKLWDLKRDINNNIPVEHNFYLKEFYLNGGVKVLNNYDVLCLDEAQDVNAMITTMFNQAKCEQKILCGDSKQSIYRWNNAINALDKVNGTVYKLTKSFRINQPTADICNMLFDKFSDGSIGMKGMNGFQNTFRRQVSPKELDKCAVICRTNALVFGNALELSWDRNLYFEGGIGGYKLDFYNKLWFFRCGKEVNDRFINKFKNYQELVEYAEDCEDVELLSSIGIVKIYNTQIPDGVKRIKDSSVNKKSDADAILTTSFKAKGQTYKVPVVIENDFNDMLDFERIKFSISYGGYNDKLKDSMKQNMLEALNVIYVAITRAFSDLYLNESLIKWLLKIDIEKETGVEL